MTRGIKNNTDDLTKAEFDVDAQGVDHGQNDTQIDEHLKQVEQQRIF